MELLIGVLIEKTKSKRADFLVNIKDMGTVLFDVKCRKKIRFHKGFEEYFALYISELEALHNLQKSILMPVWLAFTDRDKIKENDSHDFYFVSISTIINYWVGLIDYFDKEDYEITKVLRIPNSLLTKIYDEFRKRNINFCYPYEVSMFVSQMIEKDVIEYRPQKFLRLIGE
ncbi:hypothetical protein [Tenacibaculum xiamenense]|uniref:hypothetical protein n=1 Tax=Tenacibaculum xiamenense TaxID=1261553 RepID=UPI00389546F0